MIHFFASLRVRLASLVLLVVLPVFGLILHEGFQRRRHIERHGLKEAGHLTEQAARDLDEAIRDARVLLDVLAGLPETRQADRNAIEQRFRDLLRQEQAAASDTSLLPRAPSLGGDPARYLNLGLTDLRGDMIASALPRAGPVNQADRPFFRRAMATGTFAIGEFQVGRITRKTTLNVARPVLGQDGRPRGVVYAAIGLGWLGAAPAGHPLPPGSIFAVLDDRGLVLARNPNLGGQGYGTFPDSSVVEALREHRQETFRAIGPDGVERLWSIRPIGGHAGTSAYAVFGMDRKLAFVEADRETRRSLLLLAVGFVMALFAALLGAHRLVLHPVDRIVGVVSRLRAGDMDARTGMVGPGELEDLGRFLDLTAQSLQERHRELEHLAAAARRSYETLRAVITASPVAIVVHDRERRCTLWNPAAERLFGWSADEILGRTDLPDVPPEEHGEAEELTARILAGDRLNGVEVRRTRRDGTRLELSLSTAPISGPDGSAQGAVSVYTDLTAHRQLERQLHHSQKMEALGQLAGGVAHDFNNLLTVIQGFSEMAMRHDGLPAEARHDLEEVHKAARRAAELIAQLLAFSRRQPVRPRLVDLNTVVADMARMLRRLIGETIQLETRLGGQVGRVHVDLGQIEQVLANLVVNARDAMPRGGRLVIETGSHDCGDGGRPRCRPTCPGPSTTLTVSDTGTGMDEATLQHIFEPFYTTKIRGHGTGLGLSTVYGIVRQCGGDIEVASAPGAGTTFRIHLPLAAAAAGADEGAGVVVGAPRGSGTILLVEDEDDVRRFVSAALEKLGYRVLAARHGGEALAAAEREPAIDLLLTDVVMPGPGGPEVARRLREARPGLRVLYISGYAPMQDGRPARAPSRPAAAQAVLAGRAGPPGARRHGGGGVGAGERRRGAAALLPSLPCAPPRSSSPRCACSCSSSASTGSGRWTSARPATPRWRASWRTTPTS